MRHTAILAILFLGGFLVSGCGRMLGVEEDYVLREPISVRVAEGADPVTLPAGTRVRQTFFKEDAAFIQIHGRTSRRQLNASGAAQ